MGEFFQFSTDIFNWAFFGVLISLTALGLSLPAKWTQPFRSVRINIFLFVIIAIASAIGTFYPQGEFDIYHSWWFGGLLGVMAFNVIVCKLRRLPLILFGPPKKEHLNVSGSVSMIMSKATYRDDIKTHLNKKEVIEKLESWFDRKKLRYHKVKAFIKPHKTESVLYYAGRHRLQRWGDFILHVSIVIVLAGNLLGAMVGYEEALPVLEQQHQKTKHEPFEIFLKKFEIDYYRSTGVPSLYASDIEVKKNGKVVGQKRIVVNDPLDVGGVRFYQASWGMSDQFRSAKILMANQIIELKQNEVVKIPQTPFHIRANHLLPTFDVDENRRAVNRDFEGRNPTLQIDFLEKNKVVAQVYLMRDRPQMAFRVVGEELRPTDPPPFRIIEINPILFSGIQVGYDPGAPIFWIGAILMLFGLSIHIYLHQRRYRVLIHSEKGGLKLTVGGWSSRSPHDFHHEFITGVQDLRQSVS